MALVRARLRREVNRTVLVARAAVSQVPLCTARVLVDQIAEKGGWRCLSSIAVKGLAVVVAARYYDFTVSRRVRLPNDSPNANQLRRVSRLIDNDLLGIWFRAKDLEVPHVRVATYELPESLTITEHAANFSCPLVIHLFLHDRRLSIIHRAVQPSG